MKVHELVSKLQKYEPNMEVCFDDSEEGVVTIGALHIKGILESAKSAAGDNRRTVKVVLLDVGIYASDVLFKGA